MSDDLVLGEDIPEKEGDALKIKKTSVQAPNSDMQGVNTETWKDVYVSFAEQDPHIAVSDAYTGGGGFLGDVGCKGSFCYITPKITENFYKTRVKTTIYFNQHAPYIDAKVKPVYALGVEDLVKKSGSDTYLQEDKWLDLVEDASGTGKSLNEIREDSDIEAYNHDSSFIVADKVDDEDGNKRTIFYVKSAVDVDAYSVDSVTKRLISITFWEQSIMVEDKKVYVKHRWFLEGGMGKLEILYGKQDGRVRSGYKFEVHETRNTGLKILNVYCKIAEKLPVGVYKSNRPRSYAIASIVCGLYNLISLLNYVMFKQGHGLYVFQGKINGLRDALSNIVEIPANEPNGKNYSMPQILTPDPNMPKVHLEIIKEYIGFMIGLMSNNGVVLSQEQSAESGISKAFDMVGTVSQYNTTIEINKRQDKWIKKIFNLFEGRAEGLYEYETVYPKEFFPTSAVDVVEMAELAESYEEKGMGNISAEIFKDIARRLLKDVPTDRMKELMDDIEKYLLKVQDDTTTPPKNNDESK